MVGKSLWLSDNTVAIGHRLRLFCGRNKTKKTGLFAEAQIAFVSQSKSFCLTAITFYTPKEKLTSDNRLENQEVSLVKKYPEPGSNRHGSESTGV